MIEEKKKGQRTRETLVEPFRENPTVFARWEVTRFNIFFSLPPPSNSVSFSIDPFAHKDQQSNLTPDGSLRIHHVLLDIIYTLLINFIY